MAIFHGNFWIGLNWEWTLVKKKFFLKDPQLALRNLANFGVPNLTELLDQKMASLSNLCQKLSKSDSLAPHKILLQLTDYFQEPLEFIYQVSEDLLN